MSKAPTFKPYYVKIVKGRDYDGYGLCKVVGHKGELGKYGTELQLQPEGHPPLGLYEAHTYKDGDTIRATHRLRMEEQAAARQIGQKALTELHYGRRRR